MAEKQVPGVNPEGEKGEPRYGRSEAYIARALTQTESSLNPDEPFVITPDQLPDLTLENSAVFNIVSSQTSKTYWENVNKSDKKTLKYTEQMDRFKKHWAATAKQQLDGYKLDDKGVMTEKDRAEYLFLKGIGIDLLRFDQQGVQQFYDTWFKDGRNVYDFVGSIVSTHTQEDVEAHVDVLQKYAGMFDKETARDIVGLVRKAYQTPQEYVAKVQKTNGKPTSAESKRLATFNEVRKNRAEEQRTRMETETRDLLVQQAELEKDFEVLLKKSKQDRLHEFSQKNLDAAQLFCTNLRNRITQKGIDQPDGLLEPDINISVNTRDRNNIENSWFRVSGFTGWAERNNLPFYYWMKGDEAHATLLVRGPKKETDGKWYVRLYDPRKAVGGVSGEEEEEINITEDFSVYMKRELPKLEGRGEGKKFTFTDGTMVDDVEDYLYNQWFRTALPSNRGLNGSVPDGMRFQDYDLSLEHDRELPEEIIGAKGQRFQFDAKNCVALSFFAGALRYAATSRGDNEFKRTGIQNFQRDFGIHLRTREELLSEVNTDDKAEPVTPESEENKWVEAQKLLIDPKQQEKVIAAFPDILKDVPAVFHPILMRPDILKVLAGLAPMAGDVFIDGYGLEEVDMKTFTNVLQSKLGIGVEITSAGNDFFIYNPRFLEAYTQANAPLLRDVVYFSNNSVNEWYSRLEAAFENSTDQEGQCAGAVLVGYPRSVIEALMQKREDKDILRKVGKYGEGYPVYQGFQDDVIVREQAVNSFFDRLKKLPAYKRLLQNPKIFFALKEYPEMIPDEMIAGLEKQRAQQEGRVWTDAEEHQFFYASDTEAADLKHPERNQDKYLQMIEKHAIGVFDEDTPDGSGEASKLAASAAVNVLDTLPDNPSVEQVQKVLSQVWADIQRNMQAQPNASELKTYGTVAVVIKEQGKRKVVFAQTGETSLYAITKGGRVASLTQGDESDQEQIAIGDTKLHIRSYSLVDTDSMVIAMTSGVHANLSLTEIEAVIQANSGDTRKIAEGLVKRAGEVGSADRTVVVMQLPEAGSSTIDNTA